MHLLYVLYNACIAKLLNIVLIFSANKCNDIQLHFGFFTLALVEVNFFFYCIFQVQVQTTLDSNTIVSYILFFFFFFHKTKPIELRDPCFHPGYNFTKTAQSVFNTPCINGVNLPTGIISHVGLGNWSQCQQSIRKVFNITYCAYSKCSFNGVFQPSVDGKFGVRNNEDCLNEY